MPLRLGMPARHRMRCYPTNVLLRREVSTVEKHSSRVLFGFLRPRPESNPYRILLVANLPDDVEPLYFDWNTALFGKYDVLHIQWLEHFTESSPGARGLAKRLCLRLLARRLRRQQIPVVVTMHNEAPHDPPNDRDLPNYQALAKLVSAYVILNRHTRTPEGVQRREIPHGHYRDWYQRPARRAPDISPRALFFGMVRPYKNIEDLIEAFTQSDRDGSLRIIGSPNSEDYAAALHELACGDERITLDLQHIEDDRLTQEIANANFVVLPYRSMHNSGAAFLALSLNTPVVVLDNEVNRDLQNEFGDQFVFLFREQLDHAQLQRAFSRFARRTADTAPADMSNRSWDAIGEKHATLYRELASRA